MAFNSFQYAIFLPVVFIIHWILPHKYRWFFVLIASYYFYMCWNPIYVLLIAATTVVSWLTAIFIGRSANAKHKNLCVLLAVIVCLGILFFFKYFNFMMTNIVALCQLFALPMHWTTVSILLPVGISFYTFQTMSYVVDVYKGRIDPEKHLGIYAAFVSFFPQLVAGPIERADHLLPQLKQERSFDYSKSTYGLKLMAWGFFKKLVIADNLAGYIDLVYANVEYRTAFDILFSIVFFSVQIYCDFSGYSDIAIGSAKLLGIDLIQNFNKPYLSSSVKEFWSRWHISLSTWFRDYVYIPLGGNRKGKARKNINTMITFLASGLWHGANWTYVIWGGIHGGAQVLENIIPERKKPGLGKKIIRTVAVFLFCSFAWIFFRAETITDAIKLIQTGISGMISGNFFRNTLEMSKIRFLEILTWTGILMVVDLLSTKMDVIERLSKCRVWVRWSVYLLLVWLIVFCSPARKSVEFVYFQF